MAPEPHRHGPDELCETGTIVYSRALRENGVPGQLAAQAPCLLDHNLLHPDDGTPHLLRPTAPAVTLPRLLRSIEETIAQRRLQEEKLARLFEPLLPLVPPSSPLAPGRAAITVHDGLADVNAAIDRAITASHREVLTIQPGGVRPLEALALAFPRDQAFLSRGARMRTLYQHTTRHALPVQAHYERLDGDVEVRTLDEVTERLLVFDRTVAFIPASHDRQVALEIRHPALVHFLATAFDR
ncbi:helix-turn-helix transcriptional regulator, partial [Actinomycetota bacterium Odt1-20B]